MAIIYESPFEEYPGTLTFPAKFTPEMYKTWARENAARADDPKDGTVRLVANWRVAVALGEWNIDNLPESMEFADLEDTMIAAWAAEAVGLWLYPFLIMPRLHASAGAMATNGKA